MLATKCGHARGQGLTGSDWTAETIRDGIDRSLKRMRTDHLDLVHLHTCEVDVLERGEVIDALERARDAGKTRFIGYSGDEDAARWAVDSGRIDTLQTSFSIVDQHSRTMLLPQAEAKGMGVIVKRPIGNGAWGALSKPTGAPAEYIERAREMAGMGPVEDLPEDPTGLALGFLFGHPEVDTAIVGTGNPSHLRANIEMVDRGVAIDPGVVDELHRRFDALGDDWWGMT